MQAALIFAVKTTERFMWSLLQFFLKKFLLCFSLMKRPKQDKNGHRGSYAGCSYFCCENYRREELWGFCNRVEAQDITEPFQQLSLQWKCKNLGLSCKYKYYAIAIFYESKHDPCHWMNNLSGWKRTWKKLMLDWESNGLTFAMTGSYGLSIKLIKPMGEQAIVSL